MLPKVGFSVIYSSARDEPFYIGLLTDMLAAGCTAIELHVPQHDPLDNPELLQLIARFSYRAIHTSDIYSPQEQHKALAYYRNFADRIDAVALTVHPHTMQHWAWLQDYFGDKASFENMDRFKPTGKTVVDMRTILAEYKDARWTFDLNHVFTNDPSMAEVSDFYAQLGAPGHYHISGFADVSSPHTTLSTTRQNEIIHAVQNNAPIIIESLGIADIHLFQAEYDYVVERLKARVLS